MKPCIHLDKEFMHNSGVLFCWETESQIQGECPCVFYESVCYELPAYSVPCTLTPCPYNENGKCNDPETNHGNSDALCFSNRSRSIARLALGIYGE